MEILFFLLFGCAHVYVSEVCVYMHVGACVGTHQYNMNSVSSSASKEPLSAFFSKRESPFGLCGWPCHRLLEERPSSSLPRVWCRDFSAVSYVCGCHAVFPFPPSFLSFSFPISVVSLSLSRRRPLCRLSSLLSFFLFLFAFEGSLAPSRTRRGDSDNRLERSSLRCYGGVERERERGANR